MRSNFVIVLMGIVALLSGCRTSRPAQQFGSIHVQPAREGEVLVIIPGGRVANKGEHWFPAGVTLATVLDWAGLYPFALPRKVFVVSPDGHAVRYPVEGRPRKELEQIKIDHGTRIIVPYDRCFGLGPINVRCFA